VQVVRHPTERVYTRTVNLDGLTDDVVEYVSVFTSIKNILAMIPTQYHLIETAWDMQAWESRHPFLLLVNQSLG
jgi:hypothetical protein